MTQHVPRPTERLCPVCGESFDMLRMVTVTERVGNHFVGHHPTMPGLGETAQAFVATCCFENGLHFTMMDRSPEDLQRDCPSTARRDWWARSRVVAIATGDWYGDRAGTTAPPPWRT
jgi:hypothetical protein